MKKFILYLSVLNFLVLSLARAQDEKVLVIVNSQVYTSIEPEILRYIDDISVEYKVGLFETSGGSSQDLKDFIKTQADSLAGCILIGSMPEYWFEIERDEAANNSYTKFPCDLYFMDLDGLWEDRDYDGVDDTHTGNVAPEIFLARIDASKIFYMSETETEILRKYFDRDHNYWSGSYEMRKTGLAYTDMDWRNYSPINDEMQYLYGKNNYQLIKDDRVSRTDYLQNRLTNDQYEFVQVAAHSWADGQSFYLKGQFGLADIKEASLKALAYNLFACSACDYSKPCVGNAYIFSESEKSLVLVGSTKTGSMLQFYAFYQPLGQNKSIGQAYRDWFNWIAPFDSFESSWHYGMTLLGDPLIRLNSGTLNHGPLADIGSAADILWPGNEFQAEALILDDSLPSGSNITCGWEQVSGTGTATFDSIHSVKTTIRFSAPGDYRIRFTASDGQYAAEDFKNIIVSRIKWQGETPAFGQQNAMFIRDSLAFHLTCDKLHIIDIADKSHPVIIQSYDFDEANDFPYINNLDVDSNYVYLTLAEKGLKIIDITDLQNPYEISYFRTYDTSEKQNAVNVVGNLAYIADNEKGLMILDIHDRVNPVLKGYCPTAGPALALSVQGDYAYIADGSNGLRIIDISDAEHPFETGFYPLYSTNDDYRQIVQVTGRYAYISFYNEVKGYCISILDISNKQSPVEISCLEGHFFARFCVEGNYLYYSGIAFYGYELFGIYDITDKSNPKFVDSYKMDAIYFQDIRNIMVSGQFVYLLDNVTLRGMNIFRVQLPNTEPITFAGDNKTICGNNLLVKGMSFDDRSTPDSLLSYSWEQVSGPTEIEFDSPHNPVTQVINFSDSGRYVLRLTASDGDLFSYDDIRITSLNKPPKCDNLEICEGLPVPDLVACGDSIRWYADSGLTNYLDSGVSYSTGNNLPGSYVYYVTQTVAGCVSSFSRPVLTIDPLPLISLGNDTTISQDQDLILNPGMANCSHVWFDGSTEPDYIFHGMDMSAGIYDISLQVTDLNGCNSTDTLRIMVVPATGNTWTENDLMIQIYPNPTTGVIFIKLENSRDEEVTIMLLDQKGSLIKSDRINTEKPHNVLFYDISQLVPGTYFLKINTREKQFVNKIQLN